MFDQFLLDRASNKPFVPPQASSNAGAMTGFGRENWDVVSLDSSTDFDETASADSSVFQFLGKSTPTASVVTTPTVDETKMKSSPAKYSSAPLPTAPVPVCSIDLSHTTRAPQPTPSSSSSPISHCNLPYPPTPPSYPSLEGCSSNSPSPAHWSANNHPANNHPEQQTNSAPRGTSTYARSSGTVAAGFTCSRSVSSDCSSSSQNDLPTPGIAGLPSPHTLMETPEAATGIPVDGHAVPRLHVSIQHATGNDRSHGNHLHSSSSSRPPTPLIRSMRPPLIGSSQTSQGNMMRVPMPERPQSLSRSPDGPLQRGLPSSPHTTSNLPLPLSSLSNPNGAGTSYNNRNNFHFVLPVGRPPLRGALRGLDLLSGALSSSPSSSSITPVSTTSDPNSPGAPPVAKTNADQQDLTDSPGSCSVSSDATDEWLPMDEQVDHSRANSVVERAGETPQLMAIPALAAEGDESIHIPESNAPVSALGSASVDMNVVDPPICVITNAKCQRSEVEDALEEEKLMPLAAQSSSSHSDVSAAPKTNKRKRSGDDLACKLKSAKSSVGARATGSSDSGSNKTSATRSSGPGSEQDGQKQTKPKPAQTKRTKRCSESEPASARSSPKTKNAKQRTSAPPDADDEASSRVLPLRDARKRSSIPVHRDAAFGTFPSRSQCAASGTWKV